MIPSCTGSSLFAQEHRAKRWVLNGGSDTEDRNGEKGIVDGDNRIGGGSCITSRIGEGNITRGIGGGKGGKGGTGEGGGKGALW